MIAFVNVTQHYGIRPILRRINLTAQTGELVCVIGPNGMGKSTMLKVAAGLLWPQKGYVEINGIPRRHSAADESAIRKQVVFLADRPWLPRASTGREFLLAVGRLYEIDDDRLFEHIARVLAVFDLAACADAPISSYSNGQQKKIAVCSALITEAQIMLLDEPFAGGIDTAGLMALRRILKSLADRRAATILLATPVPELIESLAHRIAVIRDGELVAFDTPAAIQRMAGSPGALQGALEQLVNPHVDEQVARYLELRLA